MTRTLLAFVTCYGCRAEFLACADCVNTVRVDPATNMPPDIRRADGGQLVTVTPDAAAVQRSVPRPVCDTCWAPRPEPTWRERHERAHA